MKPFPRLLVSFPVIALAACTVPPNSSLNTGPAESWTNWQFQAGTAITSPPNTYPNFVGALQIQGTQASGILSTTASATSGTQSLPFVSIPAAAAGAATSIVTSGWQLNFAAPATPSSTVIQVGVIGGCVGPPTALPLCTAIFAVPSVGVEIAPLAGSFTGTLTNSATPSLSGTANVTVTQSTTPASDGSFPLTATIVLPAELGTYSGSGDLIGEGVSFSAVPSSPNGPSITMSAFINPAASQITVSNLVLTQAGRSNSFSGTLTRQ